VETAVDLAYTLPKKAYARRADVAQPDAQPDARPGATPVTPAS
jgi:hypothetical protein